MSVLSQAIGRTIQVDKTILKSTINPTPKSTPSLHVSLHPKSTRKSTPQLTSNNFTIDQLGHEKSINANEEYAFIPNSKNTDPMDKKMKIIWLKDKRYKNAQNYFCQIILLKGEQVAIYTTSRSPPEIITNP